MTIHPSATHVHCMECDSYTEIPEGLTAGEAECHVCVEMLIRDAHNVEPVAIFPCPNGVTAADWRLSQMQRTELTGCDDENHEYSTGNHVVEVQR